MVAGHFKHVSDWVFGLDNTLYPPAAHLFDQSEVRMTDWVMRGLGVDQPEANRLRSKYWREHGATLAGLMRLHDVDHSPYLHDVHDISFDSLTPDPDLVGHIKSLPGRCIVYTNGTAAYAEQVLAARGLSGLFDAIYGVEHADFHPKRAAMLEDDPRNLAVPHTLGIRTVHVAPEPMPSTESTDHIHHHTDDLAEFLSWLVNR